jgi:two-component system, LytTR family, sensor kinase
MKSSSTTARSSNRLWLAVLWLGVALIDAAGTVFPMRAQGMHHDWGRLFLTMVVAWLPWALATPWIIHLARRYPVFQAPAFQAPAFHAPVFQASVAKNISIHVGALAAIGLVSAAWEAALTFFLNPWSQTKPMDPYITLWLTKFSYGLLSSVIVYGLIAAISMVVDSRERMARQHTETARLNEQLSSARLGALRQQMEPHFMFNTLNAIAGLVRDNRNDAAVGMIVGLSDFLRRAADDSNRPLVELAEELEYLKRYLEIQQVRFAARLQVQLDFAPDLLRASVPNLILQPLVENAIKHGIAKRVKGGTIRVAGARLADRLRLSVYNDGPNVPAQADSTCSGIGLSNLRARLEILYGGDFELDLRNESTGGVEVLVLLPLKEP